MKITTFNIEWMNDFFYSSEPRFKVSHKKSQYSGPSISNVPTLCSRIQGTIRQINPDILGVVEGPRLHSQMEEFVRQYLNDEYSVVASPSERAQRPYLLVRRNIGMSARTLHEEPRYGEIVKRWQFYPWGAYLEKDAKRHGFYRKPLVAEIQPEAEEEKERRITVILLHIKSKHIGLKPTDKKTYVEKAILARQEITSEIKKVRDYLDDALMEEITRSMVVMGDFNDGPGRDLFEEQFMLQNLVDVIQGTLLDPELNIYHVLEDLKTGAYTLEFDDPEGGGKKRELIDHILLSPGMFSGTADFLYQKGSGKVEHEAWEKNLGENPDEVRDDRPSDHRPVSSEIAAST